MHAMWGESLDCLGDHAVSCLCGGDVHIGHHQESDILASILEEVDQAPPPKIKGGIAASRSIGRERDGPW